jgi:hypothetical protein
MHHHHRLGAGGDAPFQQLRIQVKGARIHIHKHRTRPHPADGGSRGKKTKGAGEHLIPRLDAQSLQSQHQGIGTGIAADGLQGATPQKLGKLLLKALHRRPADVLARGQQSLHLRLQQPGQSPVLPRQIQQRNRLLRHGAAFGEGGGHSPSSRMRAWVDNALGQKGSGVCLPRVELALNLSTQSEIE